MDNVEVNAGTGVAQHRRPPAVVFAGVERAHDANRDRGIHRLHGCTKRVGAIVRRVAQHVLAAIVRPTRFPIAVDFVADLPRVHIPGMGDIGELHPGRGLGRGAAAEVGGEEGLRVERLRQADELRGVHGPGVAGIAWIPGRPVILVRAAAARIAQHGDAAGRQFGDHIGVRVNVAIPVRSVAAKQGRR